MPTAKAPKPSKKTAKKTAKPSPVNGVALPLGAHEGNTGGKPGRSGRKPDEFKAMMQRLVTSEERLKQLRKVLNDANHPHFMAAYKMAAEFGYGKASQSHEHTGAGGAPIALKVTHVIVDPAADAG